MKEKEEKSLNHITWSEQVETRRKAINLYADPIFKMLIQYSEFVKLLVERYGGIHVETIEYKNREPDPLFMDGKRNLMDAMVIINGDILVDIEMQAYKKETDVRRFSHYSDLLNVLRTKRGNIYSANVSIVLLLSKYRVRKDGKESMEPILKRFDDGTVFYVNDMIVPVELVHLKKLWKKPIDELTPKERLSLWFEYSNNERYVAQMNEIYEKDKELREMEIIVKRSCMEDELYFKLRDEADEYFKELEKEIQAKKLAEQQKKLEEIESQYKQTELELNQTEFELNQIELELNQIELELIQAKQKRKAEEQKRKAEEQKRILVEKKMLEERTGAVEQLLSEGFSEAKFCKVLSMSEQELYNIMNVLKK